MNIVIARKRVGLAFARYLLKEAQEKPNIIGQIDHITMGGTPDGEKTYILIIASLRSLGMASSVDDWKLMVRSPNTPEARPAAMMSRLELDVMEKGHVGTLSVDEVLFDKAIEPIPKGKIVRGFLLFRYDQKADVVGRAGTHLQLSWADVTGTVNSAEYLCGESMPGTLARGGYPGLRGAQLHTAERDGGLVLLGDSLTS